MYYHPFLSKITIYHSTSWGNGKLLANLIRKLEIRKYIGKMEINITVNVEVSEVVI